jgi:hypothetical protein
MTLTISSQNTMSLPVSNTAGSIAFKIMIIAMVHICYVPGCKVGQWFA